MSDHKPITPERLAEIEARAKKATEGPWRAGEGFGRFHTMVIAVVDEMSTSSGGRVASGYEVASFPRNSEAPKDRPYEDGQFCAHARTDIPDLLAAVRERDEEIARLRQPRPIGPSFRHLLTRNQIHKLRVDSSMRVQDMLDLIESLWATEDKLTAENATLKARTEELTASEHAACERGNRLAGRCQDLEAECERLRAQLAEACKSVAGIFAPTQVKP